VNAERMGPRAPAPGPNGALPGGHPSTDSAFAEVWMQLGGEILSFREEVRDLPVVPRVTPAAMRRAVEWIPLEEGVPLPELLEAVTGLLRGGTVHVTSPRYFGLFNPTVLEGGLLGDAMAALYNLQLAVWSHAPAASELERRALEQYREALGLPAGSHANFTQGGAEANLTAVLAALARGAPEWCAGGVAALEGRAALYLSDESHHSFVKVARMTGLGMGALREIPTTDRFVMDPAALETRMREDRAAGFFPLMVVGTAGTTSTGAVDPLPELGRIAREAGAWFHVDAAWGGAATLSPELRPALAGIEEADSVTWDAHKWLSVPMGAGMFFCRHPESVARAFSLQASYMPPAAGGGAVDPWISTTQWSRRSIGLKVFMALAQVGVRGYARIIAHQAAMADLLRSRLREKGWMVVNDTPLPVVCFTHPALRGRDGATAAAVREIHARGRVWISEVRPGGGEPLLRACITSYQTEPSDLEVLLEELEVATREALRGRGGPRVPPATGPGGAF
jgi:aromatic-L-amino-acid/L-tryptophan decarboxylase